MGDALGNLRHRLHRIPISPEVWENSLKPLMLKLRAEA